MVWPRKTTLVATVWLTAAMTVVAGVPQFDCMCRNGQMKQACPGSRSLNTNCCCGGACCSGANSGSHSCCARTKGSAEPKRSSCCARHHESRQTFASATPSFGTDSSCCTKTPVAPEAIAVSQCKSVVHDDMAAPLWILPAVTLVPLSPITTSRQTSWQTNLLAPPTNLVTLLQRLVI